MSDFVFGSMAVDVAASSRMPIVYPGEIDPITDDSGGVDENGNPRPGKEGYIEFLPWDSDEGRKLDRALHTDVVRKGFRQKSAAELRAEAENADPAEDQVRRLVALCTGWHLVGPDRKVLDVPFSKANAETLFSSPQMAWLRRRAFAYVANERNFMKVSSSS